jgi:hypothetical protein
MTRVVAVHGVDSTGYQVVGVEIDDGWTVPEPPVGMQDAPRSREQMLRPAQAVGGQPGPVRGGPGFRCRGGRESERSRGGSLSSSPKRRDARGGGGDATPGGGGRTPRSGERQPATHHHPDGRALGHPTGAPPFPASDDGTRRSSRWPPSAQCATHRNAGRRDQTRTDVSPNSQFGSVGLSACQVACGWLRVSRRAKERATT